MPPPIDPEEHEVYRLFASLRQISVNVTGSMAMRFEAALARLRDTPRDAPSALELLLVSLLQLLNVWGGLLSRGERPALGDQAQRRDPSGSSERNPQQPPPTDDEPRAKGK